MIDNKINETDFSKQLQLGNVLTPKRFKLIDTEVCLTPFNNHSIIGRMDLLFTFNRKTYAGEIKCMTNGSFFYSTKILAYVAYGIHMGQLTSSTLPAVIVPKSEMRMEYHMIAELLNIKVFTIELSREENTRNSYKYVLSD